MRRESRGQASPIGNAPGRQRAPTATARAPRARRDYPRAPGAVLGVETGGRAPPGRLGDQRGGRSRRRANSDGGEFYGSALRPCHSGPGRSAASRVPMSGRARRRDQAASSARLNSNSVISCSSRQPENLGWRRLPSAVASWNSTSMMRPRMRGKPAIPSICAARQISSR
jgi:hypothetical protein